MPVTSTKYTHSEAMVWAGIAVGVCTDRHIFFSSTVTAVPYEDNILAQYVQPFLVVMGPDAIFTDDNVRVHRARIVSQYLESETLFRMD